MRKFRNNKLTAFLLFMLTLLTACSCEDFVVVDPPRTSLTGPTVFRDESSATAALVNIYTNMSLADTYPFSGEFSLTWMSGLMAGEYKSYFNDHRAEFFENNITPENRIIQQNWSALYSMIYTANFIIEQMSSSQHLSATFKRGMEGEARFARALMYYYLVSFWENVPLVLTTDYTENRSLPQSKPEAIYAQIIDDLQQAQTLLDPQYPTSGRIRPNQYTATALLAKVYLQTGHWTEAVQEATFVINSGLYHLETDLNKVFLASSEEVIWHLDAVSPTVYTWDAYRYVLISKPTYVTMSDALLLTFEDGDQRQKSWVGTFQVDDQIYYYPYKYKVRRIPDSPGAPVEYLVMFRLAEQYLIRAEAKLKIGDRQGALHDLNIVRTRSGLADISVTDDHELIEVIFQERGMELFTEGCSRWLDQKRRGTVQTELLPIPHSELMHNPSLSQNPGY